MVALIHTWNDAYLYEKKYVDKLQVSHPVTQELILSAHGTTGGTVVVGGDYYGAPALSALLVKTVPRLSVYRYIRLASCYSASSRVENLAMNLSLIFRDNIIKGYANTVRTICDASVIAGIISEDGVEEANDIMRIALGCTAFAEKNDEFHAIFYHRGEVVRQKLTSPEGILIV